MLCERASSEKLEHLGKFVLGKKLVEMRQVSRNIRNWRNADAVGGQTRTDSLLEVTVEILENKNNVLNLTEKIKFL